MRSVLSEFLSLVILKFLNDVIGSCMPCMVSGMVSKSGDNKASFFHKSRPLS
jgi:hypothetical protein